MHSRTIQTHTQLGLTDPRKTVDPDNPAMGNGFSSMVPRASSIVNMTAPLLRPSDALACRVGNTEVLKTSARQQLQILTPYFA